MQTQLAPGHSVKFVVKSSTRSTTKPFVAKVKMTFKDKGAEVIAVKGKIKRVITEFEGRFMPV